MPKLLLVNISANCDSTGKIAEQVGVIMMQKGWDVYLAHGARYVQPSQLKTYCIQSKTEEYMHALQARILDNDGLCSVMSTKRFVAWIKKLQPDIIHIHNLHGYYVNYRILFEYLNKTNIPVVMTLHDCWAFTGHCVHFITAHCNRWKTECHDCPLKKSVPKSILVDASRRNFRMKKRLLTANKNLHVVCVSDWMKSVVKDSFLNIHPIRHIANGIDLDIFKPTDLSPHKRFKVLGIANKWTEDKGLYDFYQLRTLLPEDEYEIKLVGMTQKQIAELPKGITGILRTNNVEELVLQYAVADVVVNPTYADTFPTINLESLACGTPVVTYRTGGSPEAIDESTGRVVEQGDVKSMANEIIDLKRHPISTEACKARALRLFNKDVCFNKYVELYEEIYNK